MTLLLAWGVLAFGGVYVWGQIGLLAGVTVAAVAMVPELQKRDARALWLLAPLLSVILLQFVPVPNAVVAKFQPAVPELHAYNLTARAPSQPLSVDRAATARAIVSVAALACIGLTTAAWLRGGPKLSRSLARNVAALAVIVAVEGLIQRGASNRKIYWFWVAEEPAWNNYFGPFVNRNHFAGWMILASSLTAGWIAANVSTGMRRVKADWHSRAVWFSTPEASRIILAGCGLLVMLVSLVWTMSRSGIAGGMLAMAIIAAAAAVRMEGARRFVTPAAIATAAASVVLWRGTDRLAAWYGTTNTLEWRIQLWRDSLPMLKDFWLTGSGLNTYGVLTLLYPMTDTTHHANAAHNDYLQLAIEGGLLVGVPAALLIAAFCRTAARRLREPQDPADWWIRLGAVAGICGMALQEVTDFSLHIPGVALLFTVLVAIAVHEVPRSEGRRRHVNRPA